MAGKVVKDAGIQDVIALGETMREADQLEVRALTGKDPRQALLESFAQSLAPQVLYVDDEVIAMWGVAEMEGTLLGGGEFAGMVWMLTSEAIERHKRTFLETALEIFPTLFKQKKVLYNAIDIRHEKAMRWGKRMGFQFQKPHPMGVEGRDFAPFTVTLQEFQCAQSQQSPR